MIEFKQEKPKEVIVFKDEKEIITLNLLSSSLTNKFYIISGFVERLSKFIGEEFDIWFEKFLKDYSNANERFKVLEPNIPYIKDYVNKYIDNSGVDFSQFVDESKVKKNSIYFSGENIKQIMKVSCYLKVYTIISNSENLKLNQRLHRKAYNEFCNEIYGTDIIEKIYNIIRTKTFRYKLTDKYMWDYIKTIQCKSIDYYVIEIFNFIMNQILVLCEENKNPITYFIGVIDESVKWFLRSVYKGTIIYNDSVSTEDIQGINVNNLKTYSYNDTIGRLKGIAYEHIYELIERGAIYKFDIKNENETITEFQNRISEVEFVSPLSDSLVYVILSRITNIPFNHFKTLSAEHSAVLSVFLKELLIKVFKSDYKTLFDLLEYYPVNRPSVSTTYKIKDTDFFIKTQNNIKNFYGFNTKLLPYDLIRYFIGRSRVKFKNVLNGKDLVGIPLTKIESDMIIFYTNFFSGKLNDQIELIKKDLYSYF